MSSAMDRQKHNIRKHSVNEDEFKSSITSPAEEHVLDSSSTVEINKVSLTSDECPQNRSILSYTPPEAKTCWNFVKSLKIEVITFVYIFAYTIRSVSSTTMLMDKVCSINLALPPEICANLSYYEFEKKQVETLANNFNLGHTLLGILPSTFLACFIGPWSDQYGRKLPIIIALIGIVIDGIGATLCAYYMNSPPQYFLISPIFVGLSGGFISVMTVVYSYASDITAYGSRTVKYALVEMAFGLGAPLGSLAGGWIFKFWGYVPVFLVSLLGHVFGLLWVVFVLDETRGIDNTDTWAVKLRNFCSTKNFADSFRTAVKKRLHRKRLQLWMLLLAMSISILVTVGSSGISYMFVHHWYDWGNTKYSTISSVFSVMSLVAMMMAVPIFTKIFGFTDPTLGMIGSVSLLCKLFGYSLAAKEWVYFVAQLCGLLSSLTNLAGRARISKIVPKSDLGKVFAFLSTVESLIPIMAVIAITQLFNATIGILPDPTFCLMFALCVIVLAVYIWLGCLPTLNIEEMQEEK